MLVAVAVAAAGAWLTGGGGHARAGRDGPAGLRALPVQAQGVVSSAVGHGNVVFAARAAGTGYRLTGGGVRATVDSHGTVLRAAGGALSLAPVGAGRPQSVSAHANRVTVHYRSGVDAWYTAGPLGIEQGFVVAHRPAEPGALRLRMRTAGSLRAVSAGGDGLRFVTPSGRVVLRYGGVAAVDAQRRPLPVRLSRSAGEVTLVVDDRHAAYPVRIDPFIQQGAVLTGTGETGGGEFGFSMALSADGNTALIGAPFDSSNVGTAFVFTRAAGVWTQQGAKLTATGGTANAQFGFSVALSADGNTALIGARLDGGGVGAAFVYTRTAGVWTQQGAKLTATGETGNARLGSSVALSADGNTAFIGASLDNANLGAAFVFIRTAGVWTQQGAKLTASGETGNGEFGFTVALSADGNTAVIGAVTDNSNVGAAFVFTRTAGIWTQQGAKLTATGETGNPNSPRASRCRPTATPRSSAPRRTTAAWGRRSCSPAPPASGPSRAPNSPPPAKPAPGNSARAWRCRPTATPR